MHAASPKNVALTVQCHHAISIDYDCSSLIALFVQCHVSCWSVIQATGIWLGKRREALLGRTDKILSHIDDIIRPPGPVQRTQLVVLFAHYKSQVGFVWGHA